MAGFKLEAFRGERPLVSNRLLQDNDAQLARNVKLGSGKLRPLRAASAVTTLARSGSNISIYKFGSGGAARWLHWTTDVNVARGPVASDTTERTYFTGVDAPRVTNSALVDVGGDNAFPESSYKLGMPAPTLAPLAAVSEAAGQGRVTAAMTSSALQARFVAYPPNYTGPNFSAPYASSIEATDGVGDVVQFELAVGTEFKVTVVDSNNVSLAAANGDPGFAPSAFLTGWKVHEASAATDQLVSVQLRIPNGVTVAIPSHYLRTGDVVKVTSVETPMTWTTTPTILIDQNAVNNATPSASNFQVSGIWTYVVSTRASEVDLAVRTYAYTWVSTLGEESAPSPPSVEVECAPTDIVTVNGFGTAPADECVTTKLRLYRTSTGTETTEFQFVTEVTLPVTSIEDDVDDEDLGEVIQTETWDPPPAGLQGIVSLPNGIFAGFVGNTLYLSEPGFPHAWPVEYRKAVDFPIVGLCVFGSSLLVCTEGVPYVGQGTTSRSFSLRRIEYDQSAVSKRSIVNIGQAAIYASPDGLVSVGNSGVALITEAIFDRDRWQGFNPSSMHAYSHDGKYIVFYSGGTEGSGALVFDPFNENVGLSRTDQSYVGGYADKLTDTLYLSTGSAVEAWEGAATYLTMLYRSKLFELDAPDNFGWLRVVAESYPLTIRVYGDEVLVDTKTITSSEPARLSSGKLYDTYYVEIEGTAVGAKVLVGDSPEEMMKG